MGAGLFQLRGFKMAICVAVSGSNLVTTSTAIGSCTDYALMTASEYAASVPSLTLDDSATYSGLVVAVWAIAWGIKSIRRTL